MSDDCVAEIVIQDDRSSDYEELQSYTNDKVRLYQNSENLSPLISRINLVQNCNYDRILLMDSDNFLDKNSFDKINSIPNPDPNTIYCPDFARPCFQFKEYSDKIIDLQFAKQQIENIGMQILLNTGNYFIPKTEYLKVCDKIDKKYAHYTVDVIYYNYLWLSNGNKIHCVKDYEYDHTMRGDSYYMTHSGFSGEKLEEVTNLYRQ